MGASVSATFKSDLRAVLKSAETYEKSLILCKDRLSVMFEKWGFFSANCRCFEISVSVLMREIESCEQVSKKFSLLKTLEDALETLREKRNHYNELRKEFEDAREVRKRMLFEKLSESFRELEVLLFKSINQKFMPEVKGPGIFPNLMSINDTDL